jgi:hypothetical protein
VICFFCHRPVRGADVPARYEWRTGPVTRDVRVYGKGELPLAEARGQLVKLSHGKCYHAHKKQLELQAARAADPSSQPRPDTDWRDQDVLDVEELTGSHEGNGDHRGAGAPG